MTTLQPFKFATDKACGGSTAATAPNAGECIRLHEVIVPILEAQIAELELKCAKIVRISSVIRPWAISIAPSHPRAWFVACAFCSDEIDGPLGVVLVKPIKTLLAQSVESTKRARRGKISVAPTPSSDLWVGCGARALNSANAIIDHLLQIVAMMTSDTAIEDTLDNIQCFITTNLAATDCPWFQEFGALYVLRAASRVRETEVTTEWKSRMVSIQLDFQEQMTVAGVGLIRTADLTLDHNPLWAGWAGQKGGAIAVGCAEDRASEPHLIDVRNQETVGMSWAKMIFPQTLSVAVMTMGSPDDVSAGDSGVLVFGYSAGVAAAINELPSVVEQHIAMVDGAMTSALAGGSAANWAGLRALNKVRAETRAIKEGLLRFESNPRQIWTQLCYVDKTLRESRLPEGKGRLSAN